MVSTAGSIVGLIVLLGYLLVGAFLLSGTLAFIKYLRRP